MPGVVAHPADCSFFGRWATRVDLEETPAILVDEPEGPRQTPGRGDDGDLDWRRRERDLVRSIPHSLDIETARGGATMIGELGRETLPRAGI
jgi:hypothetical protein